jgi:hypothetical protein
MTVSEKKTRQMPKGGRKGGSVFPRVALSDALLLARKLVSKTHTSAQPKDVILSGVMGNKSGIGEVRMSALRQYGLLKGDIKSGFAADELAKLIVSAPADELSPLYQKAILKPSVFKKLFDTFHGDSVTKAKLKQRAADLNVHPDEAETCADLYIAGMLTAGLVSVEGDRVVHQATSELVATVRQVEQEQGEHSFPDAVLEERPEHASNALTPPTEASRTGNIQNGSGSNLDSAAGAGTAMGPRAVFNVNVTLDSSLDIEKLQKQLELLKRYGAI